MHENDGQWHGIERTRIVWQPAVDEDLCTGCGLCVTGCGSGVFRFDYLRDKPVVFAPLNCLVGCMTCGITCPHHAVSFPSLSSLHRLIQKHELVEKAREELNVNVGKYRYDKEEPPGVGERNSGRING